MSFTSKELITTDKDLIRYLKKIPITMKFINNGIFIIPYDKLLSLKHDIFSKKKDSHCTELCTFTKNLSNHRPLVPSGFGST